MGNEVLYHVQLELATMGWGQCFSYFGTVSSPEKAKEEALRIWRKEGPQCYPPITSEPNRIKVSIVDLAFLKRFQGWGETGYRD